MRTSQSHGKVCKRGRAGGDVSIKQDTGEYEVRLVRKGRERGKDGEVETHRYPAIRRRIPAIQKKGLLPLRPVSPFDSG